MFQQCSLLGPRVLLVVQESPVAGAVMRVIVDDGIWWYGKPIVEDGVHVFLNFDTELLSVQKYLR